MALYMGLVLDRRTDVVEHPSAAAVDVAVAVQCSVCFADSASPSCCCIFIADVLVTGWSKSHTLSKLQCINSAVWFTPVSEALSLCLHWSPLSWPISNSTGLNSGSIWRYGRPGLPALFHLCKWYDSLMLCYYHVYFYSTLHSSTMHLTFEYRYQ